MKGSDYRYLTIFRKLGIAPELMAVVITVDFLLFGGEIFATVASPAISIPVAACVALGSMIWQRKKYRDSIVRAVAKGIALGLFTAIPTPAASILTFLAGLLPFFGQSGREELPREEKGIRKAKGKVIDTDDSHR